jgi:hypothetical protein
VILFIALPEAKDNAWDLGAVCRILPIEARSP